MIISDSRQNKRQTPFIIRNSGFTALLLFACGLFFILSSLNSEKIYSADFQCDAFSISQDMMTATDYAASHSALRLNPGVFSQTILRAKSFSRYLYQPKTLFSILFFQIAAAVALIFQRTPFPFPITQSFPLHILLQSVLPSRAGPAFA